MKNIEGILNRQEEDARIVSVTAKINKVITKKKKDIQQTKSVIKELREEMSKLKSMNSLLNDFYKKTQLRQINHYYSILKKGADVWQEGLLWVIKVLWILGENNILISKFPHFFDSQSVSYILDQAKNNINESELMAELKETKDAAREQKMRMM